MAQGFFSFALGSSDFHFINQEKNYNDSKTYCRKMFSDLASVHNTTDINNLITLVSNKTKRAWIGLESEGVREWHWSRPYQKLDFFNWKAGEPQNADQDACAVMDPLGEWFERNVDSGNHIFVAKTKSWRNAQNHCRDLSSELVSIQSVEENKAVLNISMSQNVWIGLFRDPWKWSDGSNSSFRFWTPSQPNYLEGQDCVTAIFQKDGRWNDLKCTRKERFICRGGNLILIKKNLTWIDAMSYCRRHHVDLVHITTEDIQVKVAEKAKNATSVHVWLGLRYTCNLNFWFWTSSSTGCYQNWAPGQGPEGKYECEASGAIEATGGQQWVGLSQTEKLNFLCSTCAD
uniref:C-type lectin domain-containing protein n=1 Tax=Labrus bergylta TaxID=56723 RepID=A0A3Q3ER66_9LABR